MTYADRPADTIYAITKAMIDTYDGYKDGAPGAEGMALSLQNMQLGRARTTTAPSAPSRKRACGPTPRRSTTTP